MYSAIIQIKLTQDVILSPLKFEQKSFDLGFQFKFLWIFRYSILSDQLGLVWNVCSDLLTVCLTFVLNNWSGMQRIWIWIKPYHENSVMRFF